MLQARFSKYTLDFKQASGTSRGVLRQKDSYFIALTDTDNPTVVGIGECGILKGLSFDDRPGYEEMLAKVCQEIHEIDAWLAGPLKAWPSIHFGLEMAKADLEAKAKRQFYSNTFSKGQVGIPINGLIWMGSETFMQEQIEQKLAQGYRCIKLKIGAIDFDRELQLLKSIRDKFDASQIELRVDANGAFSVADAPYKLEQLAAFDLHSIEQPIKAGQLQEMHNLCKSTLLPIALDEELIGVTELTEKERVLDTISPQYIILKPSLVGGFSGTTEWIELAEARNIPWWMTSALESNVGLNAIAQFTASFNNPMPQGLGTGQLYTNNFDSPLEIRDAQLWYDHSQAWDLSTLNV